MPVPSKIQETTQNAEMRLLDPVNVNKGKKPINKEKIRIKKKSEKKKKKTKRSQSTVVVQTVEELNIPSSQSVDTRILQKSEDTPICILPPVTSRRALSANLSGQETESDASEKICHKIPLKKKKSKKTKWAPILLAVKPSNQDLEKDRFIKANYDYDPKFNYRHQAKRTVLQKLSQPCDKLLPLVS